MDIPVGRICSETAEFELGIFPDTLLPLELPPSGLSSLLNNRFSTLVTLFTLVSEPPKLLGVEPPLKLRSRLLTLLALLIRN